MFIVVIALIVIAFISSVLNNTFCNECGHGYHGRCPIHNPRLTRNG